MSATPAYVRGSLVRTIKEFMDNPPGTLGLCYHALPKEGVFHFIFANGRTEGFTVPDAEGVLAPAGFCGQFSQMFWRTPMDAQRDYRAGIFGKLFPGS